MSEFKQYNEVVVKRGSLLSTERFSHPKLSPPKDKYFLLGSLFFFLGFAGMVPTTFFLTATDYWMYKFRDISNADYDPNNKTFLQTNFASITSTMQAIPSALTTILTSVFAHKLALRTRLLCTMTALTMGFTLLTVFVVINTDFWQFGFFIFTIVISMATTILGIIFTVSNFSLLARFPQKYIKSHTYGLSVSGIISALLQIFCLAIGGTSTHAALIYYTCATTILIITTLLVYISKYLPLYQYYLTDIEEDTRKPLPSFTDLMIVSRRVWMVILPLVLVIPMMIPSTPTITVLVVSEYSESVWGRKYFMPVSTFFLKEVASLIGRLMATPKLTRKNYKWFISVSLLQAIVLYVLFLFCNAKPRHHLPVLFPHDWQYILLTIINGFLLGYLSSLIYLSMSNLAEEKSEQGFQLLQSTTLIMVCISSPLNQVWVNVL